MNHGSAIERIAILGAGAIGGAYASMFYEMDPSCISFIAAGERAARLESAGIIVNGRHYPIPVYRPGENPAPVDLLIVAVKHHHLPQAIRDLQGSVGAETLLLSFMNGIDSEERIGSVYGMEKVLYSMILGLDAVRIVREVTFSKRGKVFFGEPRNPSPTDLVLRVKDLFDRAGIHYEIPQDMIRALWWKFMINVWINQASAALRSTYGTFQTSQEAKDLMESAMREVAAIARERGIDLTEVDIRNWYDVLSGLSPDGKTSMLQDVVAGRKTEVEMFAGKVVELGRGCNIATPVNERLFRLIKEIEQDQQARL
ncbi:MAG: 2-dehydropantoate 2-reductase [Thermodesulfobacteriota bacterium]